MSNIQDILARCNNVLPGHGPEESMRAILQALADAVTDNDYPDNYGSGAAIADLEAEVSELLGKEAAVFLPTGTMAQQIALRIWCSRRDNYTAAMHPTAHPEFAEHQGYRFLHHIQRLQFGAPEFLGERMLTVHDFEALGTMPGAILLELPYRPLGGQLPPWDELLAIRAWAQERDVPLHLDGARLWSCRPFYGKTYREIADLFDSVYVSFYKDLGGLCGAMLLGSRSFIEEARVWQIRHGGRLKTMGPFVLSARLGLERVLPQIDRWVEKTRQIAAVLSEFERIAIRPNPPHSNMFQLYIRGDHQALTERHMVLAQETGTFLFYGLGPAPVPGMATTEVHCWENAVAFGLESLRPFVERLLS
ncbi:MAG: threonine aldolase [Anaerolineae bacterium]|nr:threonine aldolase [Anaerolineae bacterium]